MKQFFKFMMVTLITCLLFGSCAAQKDQSAQKVSQATKVTEALDARDFTISIDRMIPMRGSARNVTDYYVTVRNDSLFSSLPYVGRAYNIPYGGTNGLSFSAPINSYKEDIKKNGQRNIDIKLRSTEDSYTYNIIIYDNGRSSLNVKAQQLEAISYSGELEFE